MLDLAIRPSLERLEEYVVETIDVISSSMRMSLTTLCRKRYGQK